MIILNGNADISVPNAFTKLLPGFTLFVHGEKLVAGETARHLGPRDPSSYQMTVGSEVLSERTSVLSDHGLGVHTQTSTMPAPHLPEHGLTQHALCCVRCPSLRTVVSSLSTPEHVSGVIPVYPMLSCPLPFTAISSY